MERPCSLSPHRQSAVVARIDALDNDVVRIRKSDGKLERILDLKTLDPVSSDETLLLACPFARGDIFELDLDLG